MEKQIMDILNKTCRGYVWGEMYVAQIWQVIDKEHLSEKEKTEVAIQIYS